LGHDEEVAEGCSDEELRALGIDANETVAEFKQRLEAEAQRIESEGGTVPEPMRNALDSLRSADGSSPNNVIDDSEA